ncbi:MAG: hypothetical protein Q8R29_02955 [bacterium]|nr:hypothetical protein [bacterium]
MSKLLKIYKASVFGSALLLPFAAFAQVAAPGQVNTILTNVLNTATTVIQILFVFATLVFLWGVITYIAKADDEAARKKAKGLMAWGIIGLAVMAAAWGITRLLINYFGVGGGVIPTGL